MSLIFIVCLFVFCKVCNEYDIFQVARDKVVSTWKFVENIDFAEMEYGSGYPAGLCSDILFTVGLILFLFVVIGFDLAFGEKCSFSRV